MYMYQQGMRKDNERRVRTQGDDILTPVELSEELKVPIATVYTWRYKQTGPRGIRVGKHIRFRRSDVERWLETQADPQR